MNLVNRKQYQAEIHLSGLDTIATNNMVASELAKYGFTDITISGVGKVRTAKGTYTGQTVNVAEILKSDKRIKNVKAL